MKKLKLRSIQVQSNTYLWKRSHYHATAFEHTECVEKVTIYLEGYKNSPLQLIFKEEDNLAKEKWCVGYPDSGVIWRYKDQEQSPSENIHINLNRPAVIVMLITHFIKDKWQPKTANKPLVIENALYLLDTIKLPQGI